MTAQKPVSAPGDWLKEILLAASLNLAWVLLAVFAAWLGWRSFTLSVAGSQSVGRVVRLLEDDKAAFDSDFSPVVEFQAAGKTYTFQSQNTYRWWDRYTRFSVGRQVQVVYDPLNPEHAEINSWWDIWNEPLFLGGFAFIAALALNAYLVFRWRSRRASLLPR